MEKVVTVMEVSAQTIEVCKYIAYDGKEFECEEDCRLYEKYEKQQKEKQLKEEKRLKVLGNTRQINIANNMYIDDFEEWFYFLTQEDFVEFTYYLGRNIADWELEELCFPDWIGINKIENENGSNNYYTFTSLTRNIKAMETLISTLRTIIK